MVNELKKKCGFVALIGATNSGKSTLLNTVIGKKVSIVSHKVQTTRNKIRGIKNIDDTQIIFIDTPGIFNPKGGFDRAMISSAYSAISDADAVIFLIDAHKGVSKTFDDIVKHLKNIKTPIAIVLNKVDLIKKEDLLTLTQKIVQVVPNLAMHIFMISAIKNDGVEDLLNWIIGIMPKSEWYFDDDMATDMPIFIQLAEITREKIYDYLHQELPYGIAIKTEKIVEDNPSHLTIHQTIYTEEDNHKSMILGAKGEKIKTIGTKARIEMEALVGKKVHLDLFVKAKENWKSTPEFFHDIGLKFNV